MYNDERKRMYLEEKGELIDTPLNILTTRFNQVQEMEENLGKDVADFTGYELMEFYKRRNFTALDTLIVTDSLMSDYTDWCISKNLVKDGQNHHIELTNDILGMCLNKVKGQKRYLNREQLVSYLEKGNNGKMLNNPVDQFVMLALFEGIKGNDFEDLYSLKMADFNGNVVSLESGRKFTVSDRLIEYARKANDLYEYYPLTIADNMLVRPLRGDGIVKEYCNTSEDADAFRKGRRIYTKVKLILSWLDLDMEISANTLYESGRLQFIRERSAELNMTPKEYLAKTETDSEYTSRYKKLNRSVYWRKYSEYLE